MLMLKILENDLHRSKNESAVPLIVDVPASKNFLPALVSNALGKFLVSRKLTSDNYIRVGVFKHDPDKIDQMIPEMVSSALDLSKSEKWKNVFNGVGQETISKAFEYIVKKSAVPAQPHVCLIPRPWERDRVEEIFGAQGNLLKYRRYCNIIQVDIDFVVFLSKPDFVGMYTHFLGNSGFSAILMHNVKNGMAFCLPE